MSQSLYGISLRSLLPEARFLGGDDVRVESCSADSRNCRAGDLFVALPGSQHDGHDHVGEALRRGVKAVLAQQPIAAPVPVCVVPDARQAFGELCHALAGDPSTRLKVIGITGTNGKTTTSYLVASVLLAGGRPTGISGTLGYFDGYESQPAQLTTPAAPTLATWLARSEANGCTHAVMEASSHGLSQQRMVGLTLDVACVTNIRHDHLDFHGNWNKYRDAKASIVEHLDASGVLVVNADDRGSASLLDGYGGPAISVGIDAQAEVTATIVEQTVSEQTFLLSVGHDTVPVRTRLIGTHNIENCLMAAAVGFTYGLDVATIAQGLESLDRVPGRLERIECGQPFGVFVDFAHTADALTSVLATLRRMTPGRLICVFGAAGERDRSKRPAMGHAVAKLADVAIVTTDNPRHEEPRRIAHDVLRGMSGCESVYSVFDRHEAIRLALQSAREGDCVLLAGKGHEREQIIGDERHPCDDRQIAREWLYRAAREVQVERAKAA